MPHRRPSLAKPVGCNAPRARPPTFLGSRGVLLNGTTRFFASLPASPHRLRGLSTHMTPVRSVRPVAMTLGRQWQQCLLGDTIARPARVVRAPPPCLMCRGRHFSGDLRRENYPGEPTQPTKGTYMSRWGLRATAPRVASTWCNLGSPRGNDGVRPLKRAPKCKFIWHGKQAK